jgi:hypothetical protein
MLNATRYIPALIVAAAVAAVTSACAAPLYQSRGIYSQDFERRAYENGRREGLDQGRDDARNRRDFSFARHDEYRDGDRGYRRSDGDRDRYRRTFRQGYQDGYTEAFNQVARTFPRRAPSLGRAVPRDRSIAATPAFDVGYRDGIDTGRDDARRRRRFNPGGSSRYRSADRGYDRRYGSLDQYRRDYRSGFERGYEAGFRGY